MHQLNQGFILLVHLIFAMETLSMESSLTSKCPDWKQKLMSQSPEVQDYFHEVMACEYSRSLPNDTFLLPKQNSKNTFVLIQTTKDRILFCPECDDFVSFKNVRRDKNQEFARKSFCIHLQAVHLMKTQSKINSEKLDEKTDTVFYVQEKPIKIAIVYPKKTEFGKEINKYAIYAYTHGPVTGSGPSVVTPLLPPLCSY